MKIVKAYKYKVKPNKNIEKKFRQIAGCCRFVYNLFLNQRIQEYGTDYVCVSYYEQAMQLPALKDEYQWLKDCPSQCLQQALKDLDMAYKHFFRRCGKGEVAGFPRFHKKGVRDSFRYPQGVKVSENIVFLPKVGWLKFFKSREMEGEIKNTTVVRESDGWYVSFQTEKELDEPVHPSTSTIGVDRGVRYFGVCSDNSYIEGPVTKKYRCKLVSEQKKLARKKKGSNNWKKQKARISKLHKKIANIRNDFLHKTSTNLCKNHACIVLENLQVKNMSKSAKGTLENPGRNVKAKAGLNREILNQGWYKFQTMLEYKQKYTGGTVLYVDPKYTSQKCCRCGCKAKENRKSQECFLCIECGFSCNADYNAAVNIKKAAGQAVSACGESA